jgi:hypothetical protein
MPLDLTHIFGGDDDVGQERHGDLPHEAKLHMAQIFAHHARLGPHPGEYKGPPIGDYSDEESEAGQKEREDAIDNLSLGSPAKIPGTPKPPAPPDISPS